MSKTRFYALALLVLAVAVVWLALLALLGALRARYQVHAPSPPQVVDLEVESTPALSVRSASIPPTRPAIRIREQRAVCVVATGGRYLNVRTGPGIGYRVLRVVREGQRLELTGQTSAGWRELNSGGWVNANLCVLTVPE